MRRRAPSDSMSETGKANSHSVLGIVEGCLVLKLSRRRHMATGAFLKRSCCC